MLKNTELNYGLVARTLHWSSALLFLGAYIAVYTRRWFTDKGTPENWTSLQLHLSLGVSIGVLVMLRIIWNRMNRQPNHEPGSPLAHLAAKGGHLALYAVLIGMPLTGYLGTGVATEMYFLFDIPKFEDTWLFKALVEQGMGLDFKTFEKPMDFIHKQGGAWLVWLLILGHAGAALYHHFVLKDRTLIKMTSGRG